MEKEVRNIPEFIYETKNGKYSFEDTGSCIVIWRNGRKWGSPPMDGALRSVINDLIELREENCRLKEELSDYTRKLINARSSTAIPFHKMSEKARRETVEAMLDE
ncbi:hypothetical protein [Paenibacillus sp. NAIST15-1]|uniref:hypothetical protein n=1 Tax=Paenibacillus sp. NAIST15-1 TaxID=1605994 RepID=UPI00086EEEAF|nr:hypothetical protein [Paenibacillus sp. NAIST15-1]GAV11473.1 V-type ATP synthase subunit D [Paenibacillus sp. NAIST15-1]